MERGGRSEWRRQRRVQAGGDFSFYLFYTSGERAPGDRGIEQLSCEAATPTPKLSAEGARRESLPLSRLLPPFLSPTSCPPHLILSSCPCGMGWQRGLEVWGWVGVSPCEAHVERRAGAGTAAAVSLFPAHWFLLGTHPGSPVSWAGRASHPAWGAPPWTGGREGGCPLTHPTGTCGVRGPSSIRLQLVTGLCPPCPLGLQGGSSAAWIRGP